MRKLSKKLLLSVLSVALIFIALGTTTFAWFSMNTKVTATGMTVTTRVSDNLLIADSSAAAETASAGEAAFKTAVEESVTAVIEPVSTVDGVAFFYNKANNSGANGARLDSSINYIAYSEETALANTAAKKTNKDQAFNSEYGFSGADTANVCYGYVDYVFELKAANTTNATKYINLKQLDLVSSNATVTEKAFRVAMFVQAGTVVDNVVTSYAAFPATATSILAVSGATLHDNTAVSAVNAKAAVTPAGAATSLQVLQNSTAYYKVTLRLYIEGEDTTCTNSTFMTLTNEWNLDVMFALEASTSASASLQQLRLFKAFSADLNGATTKLYYDGTNIFRVNDMSLLNTEGTTKIPTAAIAAEELAAINTATGATFTRSDD